MKEYKQVRSALLGYQESWETLRKLEVVKNKKDFTSQVGEWFASKLYNSKLARNTNQKDWDIEIESKKVQVKTHAKASTNNVRRTTLKYPDNAEIDLLLIIIFTPDYKLKELYEIKWKETIPLLKGKVPKRLLYWDDLKSYKKDLKNSPNKELLNLFEK